MSEKDNKDYKPKRQGDSPPNDRQRPSKPRLPTSSKGSEVIIHRPKGASQRSGHQHAVPKDSSWRVADPHSPSTRAKPQSKTAVLSEAEIVRDRLNKAGVLATNLGVPPNLARVSDEELRNSGDMPPWARPSEVLVSEDRGD